MIFQGVFEKAGKLGGWPHIVLCSFVCLSLFAFQSKLTGHFRVRLNLHFKARLSAKSLLWKSVFIHIEIGTNCHNKSFALRLALKERLRGTRKWPTEIQVQPVPKFELFEKNRSRVSDFIPA